MFGLQPWDIEIGSNFKNIARVMSRQNRVLYINRPLDRITRWRAPNDPKTKSRLESIRDTKKHIRQMGENLWVLSPRVILESINKLPRGRFYNYLNKLNSRRIAREIISAVDHLGFDKDVLIIDNDFLNGLYLQDYVKSKFFLYYLRDYLLSQEYFEKHGVRAEPKMIAKAGAVASNSLFLSAYARKFNKDSYYVGQGCVVDTFLKNDYARPADLPSENRPVIGYCGMLTSKRLDISLLISIAQSIPDFDLLLVGPQDNEFQQSALHSISNVSFLGAKKENELPAYVHHFDVCINPQLVNPMTIGNYPRKIDEYLAAGKPTVATKTETMMAFKDIVYLCESREEFIKSILDAYKNRLDENKINRRIQEAGKHTWEASVDLIYDILESRLI